MKLRDPVFIAVFLAAITAPLVFMDRNSTAGAENRNLAAWPDLITDGKINTANVRSLPRLLDAYFSDRFGFRTPAVSLWNGLLARFSGRKTAGTAIFGKNGWLYYSSPSDGNNLYDWFKINLFSGDEIRRAEENLRRRKEWCEANGIHFLFLVAPNKHNAYPEYYPFRRPPGKTRMEHFLEGISGSAKEYVIFPLDHIVRNKSEGGLLYYETDTHWNMSGAFRAFELLRPEIAGFFPGTVFPAPDFETALSYGQGGDIVPMAGFSAYGGMTVPAVAPAGGWESYYLYLKNEGTGGVVTENRDSALPGAVIYRDSFFTALEPFTSLLFSSAEYHWRGFSAGEKEYLLETRPDIVIWEMVERYLGSLPQAAFD